MSCIVNNLLEQQFSYGFGGKKIENSKNLG